MTTLADLQFKDLMVGMKFKHSKHGEQIVLDLDRGLLGPTIRFHNCSIYSGEMPRLREEGGDVSVFQLVIETTYPYGAEEWLYQGMAGDDEIAAWGLRRFELRCPHCGFAHLLLTLQVPAVSRQCRECGMAFTRAVAHMPL